jgi:SRSO17 transposase
MRLGAPEYAVAFKMFCAEVFATLGRTDQRNAAETYLYGLLNCTGRKSIRQIVAAAPGRSEQSLQQFINQSPWDPDPIRRELLKHLLRHLQPTAWVLEEVHFPKHGRYSAAVERQYVHSLGRVSNCQMAIAVILTDEQHTVPVNWRLVVPEQWGRDHERRARARLPDHELPRPYWQYHLEALDDMALDWGMPAAPVLVDTARPANVEAFLAALELRRQPYLAQVHPTQRLCCEGTGPRLARGVANSAAASSQWHGTISDLVARTGNVARETVEWQPDQHGVLRSQFLRIPLRATLADSAGGRPGGPAPQRMLLCEWPFGKARPRAYWISNMDDRPLSELVALAKLRHRAGPRIEEFAGQYGLRDYEGRTFAGWHHHVTMATAGYTFDIIEGLSGSYAHETRQVTAS